MSTEITFTRPIFKTLLGRFKEPRRFIQVLSGPRQTGKTILARQLMAQSDMPVQYATADEPALKGPAWIEQQWEALRSAVRRAGQNGKGLLVLDEVHKIGGWSETVKRLWDEDTAAGVRIHVLLLGSSPLLVRRGLADSLAGRFEIMPVSHWSYDEMRTAFGWSVEKYVFFGAYPGAASLIGDRPRWSRYIIDSMVETTLSRDILLTTRVDKPALLRSLFDLGCAYSGQVLSYQKMLGQLQDAGNTTTLAHYLQLLAESGMLAGLQKYAGQKHRRRSSSPKLIVMNTALMSAHSNLSLEEAMSDPARWGRLVESAVGASLLSAIQGRDMELCYWASGVREVDFVLVRGRAIAAIEVKSGRRGPGRAPSGPEAFSREFEVKRNILVGSGGIPLEEFLLTDPQEWVR